MFCRRFVFLFAAALVPASFSQAALISVPNGSFENAGFNWQVPSDWQSEGSFQLIGTGTTVAGMPAPSDNSQLAAVSIVGDADAGTSFVGGLSSLASLGTYTADTVYTLTFDVGAEGMWWNSWQGDSRKLSAGLGIFTSSSTAATPVVIDTTDLQEPAPTGGESYVLLPGAIVEGSHSYSGWKRFTVTLDTGVDPSAVGSDISVILAWNQNDNYNKQIVFDNVTLDAVTAIPEPSSIFLLGGVSLLAFCKRRLRS